MKLTPLLVVAASLVTTSAAASQNGLPPKEERDRIQALSQDWGNWRYHSGLMGLRWSSGFQHSAGSVSIYFTGGGAPGPDGRQNTARYVAKQIERRVFQPDTVVWADSDECPALMALVESFENLPATPTRVPGLRFPPEFPVIVLDGTAWTIWSRSAVQEGRFPAQTQISSNSGPIASWGATALESLKPCWRAEEPAA